MLHNLPSVAVLIGALRVMLTDHLNLIMAVDWDLNHKPNKSMVSGQLVCCTFLGHSYRHCNVYQQHT